MAIKRSIITSNIFFTLFVISHAAEFVIILISQLIEGNGHETRQTPLLYVFVDLKVHNVQKNSYHFDCIDQ